MAPALTKSVMVLDDLTDEANDGQYLPCGLPNGCEVCVRELASLGRSSSALSL